jgi:hypothetical protein
VPPEHIEQSELAYHADAFDQLRAAQAAWQSWMGFLARKYALGPNDGITPQGMILRNARMPENLSPPAEGETAAS